MTSSYRPRPHTRLTGLWILVLFAALTLGLVSACKPPAASILGEWVPVPGANHFQVASIRFEENAEFFFDQTAGRWETTDGKKLTLHFPNVLPNTYDFEVTREGKLVLKDQGGLAGEFVRPDNTKKL